MGLGNYFIDGYCTIVEPLQELTHIDVNFKWGPTGQAVVDNLRKAFCLFSPNACLSYVLMCEGHSNHVQNPQGQFIVHTDASDYLVGGVMSHVLRIVRGE